MDTEPVTVHAALYKCPVYFVGRRAPLDCTILVEAMQKPLLEMFKNGLNRKGLREIDLPREGHLFVLTSGIMFLPVNPIDKNIWLRMEDFRGGCAVKANGPYGCGMRFDELNSRSPQCQSSELVPIYSLIVTRTNGGVMLNDCYAFSFATDSDALNAQTAVDSAHANKCGWSGSNLPPKIDFRNMGEVYFEEGGAPTTYAGERCFDGPIDRYFKPSKDKYFYAPSTFSIKEFELKDNSRSRPLNDASNTSKTCLSNWIGNGGEFQRQPIANPCQGVTLDFPSPPTYKYVVARNKAKSPTRSKATLEKEYLLYDENTGQPVSFDDPNDFDFASLGIDPNDPTIRVVRADQLDNSVYEGYSCTKLGPKSKIKTWKKKKEKAYNRKRRLIAERLSSSDEDADDGDDYFILKDKFTGKCVECDDPATFDYAMFGLDPNDPTIKFVRAK